jgi:S1-C subfamily serine protease
VDAWIEIHEGGTAGAIHRLGSGPVVVGRHAGADLRLDPEKDLSASGRHAVLIPMASGWAIRDLQSTNGTWVNDAPVEGDHPLTNGDRIRLGPGGPLLIFRTASSEPDPTRMVPGGGGAAPKRPFPWLAVAVSAASLTVLSSVFYVAGRLATRRDWEHERAALEGRMDSMLSVAQRQVADIQARNDSLERNSGSNVESLQLRVSGLLEALQRSEAEVRSLRTSLQAAEGGGLDDSVVTSLRQRLQSVSVALERQQLAAALDFKTIEKATRRGTAQIYVELGKEVVTGTAFGVSRSGILMTNRHVLEGPDGSARPGRIGIQFADSRQVWPAHILRVSRTADLALVQVERLEGDIPTVLGFNARTDTLASGSPVAMLGFPLGGRPPEGSAGVIRPLLTAGVLAGNRGGLLEVQGYGEKGASGSPVLDRDGKVVGILVGGTGTDVERTLLAVPASDAIRLLGKGG